jgi:hypothetical protein
MGLMQALSNVLNPQTAAAVETFPPKDHEARIQRYEANRIIYEGDAQAVGSVLVSNERVIYGEYTSVNIAKNIVTIPADFLFGEELELDFDDDVQEGDVERVQEIWERNDIQQLAYENAIDTGYKGDGLFVVGRDGENGPATVTTQNVDYWFPECDQDNVRDIKMHRIARVIELGERDKKKKFLRVKEYDKGYVRNRLLVMKGNQVTSLEASDDVWNELYPDGRPPEEIKTGVDDFLIVHVPNFRSAQEYFGRGEYQGAESMLAAINARFTQVDGILDRHSDPIMGLPQNVATKLTDGGKKTADLSELEWMALGDNGEMAQMLTWDGQLQHNFEFIGQAVDLLATITETAPQLLNRGDWGSDLSGKALKILLIRTLAKVNRKRNYFGAALSKVLELAQRVEGVENPINVKIKFADGLPQDVLEKVAEVDARLANGTMSRKGAVKALDGVDDSHAEQTLEDIAEEGDKDMESLNKQTAGRPKANIPVTVNLGKEE